MHVSDCSGPEGVGHSIRKLATEEEFDEALLLSKPILAFAQDLTSPEPDAQRLLREISDGVKGGFRKRSIHRSRSDLVARSVRSLVDTMDLPAADPRRVSDLLLSNRDQSSEPSIRLVLVPERLLELVPPERLESRDLVQEIYVAGRDRSVSFFDSSVGKESHLAANGVLRITQRSQSGRHREEASLALSEAGELTLVKDVRERDSGDPIQARHLLVEADLKASLERSFLCAAAVLDLVDPHDRCSSLWSGVAIQGATHRYLHSDTPLRSGIPTRMGDAGPTIAEKGSRRISRGVLRSPAGEIDRLMALFRRSLAPPKHS